MSGIVSVVSVVLPLYAYIYPPIPKIYVSEAIVGVAPFQVNDRNNLEDKYLGLLKSANKYLRKHNNRYRLAVDISERGGYTGVIKDLGEGDIKMAFISSFSYCLNKDSINNKVQYGGLCHCINKKNKQKIQTIGFLRKHNQGVYSYGIIYNLNSKDGESKKLWDKKTISIEDTTTITNVLKHYGDKNGILLCDEELSTSTHVLPEIFLLEHGIDIRSIVKHESVSRSAMKDSVRKKDCIAFFSNEDYERLDDKEGIGFCKIDFPSIPYDAILVNSDWWKELKKDTAAIISALDNLPIGFEGRNENSDREREIFKMYVCSGIIGKDTITVTLPDRRFDAYHLRDSIGHPVKIVSFKDWNRNTTMYSALDTVHRGTGILIKKNGIYFINSIKSIDSLKISPGYHILPM
ncbi:hypothetical protein FACS1894207_4740 [Bacteroidia bacterium]|nr:hypothetical protein FACS1894207_4740 [Bacteroidia bacterium]